MVDRKKKRPIALARLLELKRALREASAEVQWMINEVRFRGEGALLTETEHAALVVAMDGVDDATGDVYACVKHDDDPRQLQLVPKGEPS